MQKHKTRMSDSSLYDEVCVWCGATDGNGVAALNGPCPKAPVTPSAEQFFESWKVTAGFHLLSTAEWPFRFAEDYANRILTSTTSGV